MRELVLIIFPLTLYPSSMFYQISEKRMHQVRWFTTLGWLILIASLFYDPWTVSLTQPDHPWSPLRIKTTCVQFQGQCLTQQPYPLANNLFWGAVVPSSILILLVFGHELWRRICPLSFLSQIPRSLGIQRKFQRKNSKTGKIRLELVKIKANSWLAKNYPYVQFAWLFTGLCGRLLFFDSHRLALGLWMVFTILCALTVGYLYEGKSWCQYFCPMAPVQKIYAEPRALFGSKAHTGAEPITQSMCRTVLPDGKEQSACVACQNPCIDIDAERTYWQGLNQKSETFTRYGYFGLTVGFFLYYYLYAGGWDFYFSGIWSRQPDQLDYLFRPGFYILGQTINIPKILAVPITLGLFTLLGHQLGKWIEKRFKSNNINRHRIFIISTFIIFKFFFIFGGRMLVLLLPVGFQHLWQSILMISGSLWLYQTWQRNPGIYSRENLANRFRKQLEKMNLDLSLYLDGRSLGDLTPDEIYILAKVLPGFSRENRRQAYKGVLREALEENYVNYSTSLELLRQMRMSLGITDQDHEKILQELEIEDFDLLIKKD